MTNLERRIYEVRRLTGITALMYEMTYDGSFTVRWPGGRVRITDSSEPRDVAAAVLREAVTTNRPLQTPIPQPGQPAAS